jgi:hypothetical protein
VTNMANYSGCKGIMGQIRNVLLIVVITFVMALLTVIIAYFFDHFSANGLKQAGYYIAELIPRHIPPI